jgi:hypothetical protein
MTDVNTRTATTTAAATIRETSTRNLLASLAYGAAPLGLSEFPVGDRNRESLAARVDVFDQQSIAHAHLGRALSLDETSGELDHAAIAHDGDDAAAVTEGRDRLGLFEHKGPEG